MTYTAYNAAQRAHESPLELELRAVADMTRRLERANAPGCNKIERVKALHWNGRMWAIFVHDLSEPGNMLPEQIRARYISIGLFVQRKTAAVMTSDADLSTLIAINRDLLEALEGQNRASAMTAARAPASIAHAILA